ncbi:hypothetical protein [Arenibaculum sp.]|jgi:hypothetical protein|uniref:hypothetical protein n=1 Tax=Arenibaculum sp. TaxID=2865862 RepID=UPI002E154487|nr:hypothetical protein [Arenibaculum sp.]
MHPVLWVVAGLVGVKVLSSSAREAGEGADQAGNGALKLAAAAALGLYALHKARVL